jgi:DNA-binding response OmpR family regulator
MSKYVHMLADVHVRAHREKGLSGSGGGPISRVFATVTDDRLPLSEVSAVPTVLIADDDADHRELLRLALRRFGHHTVEATDARSAMQALERGGIDVVLLDNRMPGESGIEFCRRLRQDPATATLPIMFVSADVNDSRILTALQAGADDYLTKPFHRTELGARLDNLLMIRGSVPGRSATAANAAIRAARSALHRPAAREVEEPVRRTA